MDERLQALLNNVQKTASSAGDAAADAAASVSRKATQLLSVGKINMQLTELRANVAGQLREIGEMVYATHTGNPTDSDVLLEKLQVIDGLNAQIDALTAELRKARGEGGAVVCPNCGTIARKGDRFCRSCGGRL